MYFYKLNIMFVVYFWIWKYFPITFSYFSDHKHLRIAPKGLVISDDFYDRLSAELPLSIDFPLNLFLYKIRYFSNHPRSDELETAQMELRSSEAIFGLRFGGLPISRSLSGFHHDFGS